MTRRRRLALLLPLAGFLLAFGPLDLEPAPEGLDAREIAARADDALGGERSVLEARMSVLSPRESERRTVRFRRYHDRSRRKTFLRVLEPERDAGTSFLMLDPNLWVYVPSADRTVLVRRSTLGGSWLGGDFTHEDLVRVWRSLEDYDHRLLGIDRRAGASPESPFYVLESTPAPGRAPPWPRILTWIEVASGVPLRREYFGADGVRSRVLQFSDVRRVGGRRIPHRWTLTPAEGEGRETRIEIQTIDVGGTFADSVFSTRFLASKP